MFVKRVWTTVSIWFLRCVSGWKTKRTKTQQITLDGECSRVFVRCNGVMKVYLVDLFVSQAKMPDFTGFVWGSVYLWASQSVLIPVVSEVLFWKIENSENAGTKFLNRACSVWKRSGAVCRLEWCEWPEIILPNIWQCARDPLQKLGRFFCPVGPFQSFNFMCQCTQMKSHLSEPVVQVPCESKCSRRVRTQTRPLFGLVTLDICCERCGCVGKFLSINCAPRRGGVVSFVQHDIQRRCCQLTVTDWWRSCCGDGTMCQKQWCWRDSHQGQDVHSL